MSKNGFAEANNKYKHNYKWFEHPNYIDCNNLYGKTVKEYLSYKEFEWVDPNIVIKSLHKNPPKGYILEIDLE